MHYLIYKITNNLNKKYYIGCHKTKNINDEYMGSGKAIQNAIKKYGKENFIKEILFECNSIEEMFDKEKEFVTKDVVNDKMSYNLKPGGYGNYYYINENHLNHSSNQHLIASNKIKSDKEYAKNFSKKVSDGLKLYYSNPTISNPFKGKKHKDSSKQKIGLANSVHQKGSGNSNYGKCWIYNDELKISKSIKKEEIDIWIEKGWKKGRRILF